MTTVWIYEEGDVLQEFETEADARAWLKQNDPDGVVLEYEVGDLRPAGTADLNGVPRATEPPRHGLRLVK
jgi:hypothetical protein